MQRVCRSRSFIGMANCKRDRKHIRPPKNQGPEGMMFMIVPHDADIY
jgi:hypothetical protein